MPLMLKTPRYIRLVLHLFLCIGFCRNSGPDIVFGIIVLLNQNCCLSSGVRLPFPARDRTGSWESSELSPGVWRGELFLSSFLLSLLSFSLILSPIHNLRKSHLPLPWLYYVGSQGVLISHWPLSLQNGHVCSSGLPAVSLLSYLACTHKESMIHTYISLTA